MARTTRLSKQPFVLQEEAQRAGRRRSGWKSLLVLARRKPLGAVCLIVVIGLVFCAGFAPIIAPYDPTETAPSESLQSPSRQHLMGTDQFGRDVFSRLVYGSRVSLIAGLLATFFGVVIGAVLGMVGAYVGGVTDMTIQRIADAIMALPGLVVLMVLALVLGPSFFNIVIALSIFVAPFASRIARGSVLAVKGQSYIEAARVVGVKPIRMMSSHITPNILAPLIVIASITVGNAILVETSVSFLGLGVQPPEPTWGNMLSREGRQFMREAPWLAWFPGLAITITVLAFNLLGDTVRDILDPRLRGT
jgi:peptide/nickel transport system permease protein